MTTGVTGWYHAFEWVGVFLDGRLVPRFVCVGTLGTMGTYDEVEVVDADGLICGIKSEELPVDLGMVMASMGLKSGRGGASCADTAIEYVLIDKAVKNAAVPEVKLSHGYFLRFVKLLPCSILNII